MKYELLAAFLLFMIPTILVYLHTTWLISRGKAEEAVPGARLMIRKLKWWTGVVDILLTGGFVIILIVLLPYIWALALTLLWAGIQWGTLRADIHTARHYGLYRNKEASI